MIDKKTRIKLRSMASTMKPVVWVGKDGFTENVLKQIEEEHSMGQNLMKHQ